MARLKVDVDQKSLNKLLKNIKSYSEKKQAEVKKEILRAALEVDAKAKENAPVDSGRLRSSINTEMINEGYAGEIRVPVKYAAKLEFGNYKRRSGPMAGQSTKFLFPAFESVRPEFIKNLKEILKKK